MNTLRRLALGFASALALTPAFAGAARAGDVTYPQLTTATTVVDTDVLATWRGAGPLTRINASTLAAYLQGKFNSDYLQISNNLSEFATSPGTARSNLGLGTAATQNTGTSGLALCLMNANCTWSGTQVFGAAVTMNSMLSVAGAITATGGVVGNVTGNASGNAGTASQWQTTRTESLTGDISGSAPVNGAGNWSIGTTIQPGAVTATKMAAGAAAGNLGFTPLNPANNLSDLQSIATALSHLGFQSSGSNAGSVTIATSNGNVIINWGIETNMSPGGTSALETFSTPFPTGVTAVCSGLGGGSAAIVFYSTSQIQVKNTWSGTQNVGWIAIGK